VVGQHRGDHLNDLVSWALVAVAQLLGHGRNPL
jgi:hypothetical protein